MVFKPYSNDVVESVHNDIFTKKSRTEHAAHPNENIDAKQSTQAMPSKLIDIRTICKQLKTLLGRKIAEYNDNVFWGQVKFFMFLF